MSKESNKPNGIMMGLLSFIALMQIVIFVFMLGLWSMTNDRIADIASTMAATMAATIKAIMGG